MPPNFFLQKNLSVFFLSPQKITGFIIFYCLLPVVFRKTFHSTPQQFSAFLFEILMFSFKDTPKFIATCLFINSSRSFFPLKFFHISIIKKLLFVYKAVCLSLSPAKKLMLCSFISGEQVLTPSLSKQPPIPTKFPSFLTIYDTHKVYTETLSFSHLWGHLCPFNHLYGNVNIF